MKRKGGGGGGGEGEGGGRGRRGRGRRGRGGQEREDTRVRVAPKRRRTTKSAVLPENDVSSSLRQNLYLMASAQKLRKTQHL